MKRWAIFISGTGSNMMAFLEQERIAKTVIVVSSSGKALGLQRARSRGVNTLVFKKEESWSDLSQALKDLHVDCILLAGFMRILPKEFLKDWSGKVYNIHPSLLPRYPGLNSIARAHQDRVDSGVTLHMVDEGVDTGKVVFQKEVQFCESRSWFELKMHIAEHRLVRKLAEYVQ